MLANRGRNTGPELEFRRQLRAAGFLGYRLHWRTSAGIRPDVVFTARRIALFVHGCFWHGCPTCRLQRPKTHSEFWQAKFRANRSRDRRKRRVLESDGWRVVEVWSHELEEIGAMERRLMRELRG
jgi:DNA mismatch endonuclease (patch repair protein)